MKFIILGVPVQTKMCSRLPCAVRAARGIRSMEEKLTKPHLNDLSIGKCQACDDGWGLFARATVSGGDDSRHCINACRGGPVLFWLPPVYWGFWSEVG